MLIITIYTQYANIFIETEQIMKDLSNTDLSKLGMNINNRIMDNGELRLGVTFSDNTAYTRSQCTLSGWQNAHYHSTLTEIYYIQSGKILLATLKKGKILVKELFAGDLFRIEPMVSHNLWLSKGTILENMKVGDVKISDWNFDEKLQEASLNLNLDNYFD